LEIVLAALAVAGGFVALVWGADRFVEGAAATARNLGISPLIIGLTIVGFGTSAPEMLVSGIAAHAGNGGLSVGNAIGSNITNVGLVIGLAAIIAPLTVHSKIISRELPVLLGTMVLSFVLMLDGHLGRADGAILFTGLGLMVGWIVREGLRDRTKVGEPDALEREFAEEIPTQMSTPLALFWVGFGLVVLLGSARLVVWGAATLATWFGVSDLVIGLTVVAFGTSLPELAASIISALKDEHDIAIGNVIGSNMFNLLGVLALPAVIAPGPVQEGVLERDYPSMFALTFVLFVMARGFRVRARVTRVDGVILVACFTVYVVLLFLQASGVI
jgi:cation:H+ antiporter